MAKENSQYIEHNKGHDSSGKKGSAAQSTWDFFRPYVISVIIALLVVFAVKHIFGVIIVQGDSMNPTYYNGDLLREQTKFEEKNIKSGDVITFRINGERLIKRVIGVPGDVISYKDHIVYINGVPENSVYPEIKDGGLLEDKKIRLASDEYFCMGDNRNNSRDCRAFGPIKFSQIDGKIIGTYFHRNETEKLKEGD